MASFERPGWAKNRSIFRRPASAWWATHDCKCRASVGQMSEPSRSLTTSTFSSAKSSNVATGMPEVVKANPRQSGPLDDLFERIPRDIRLAEPSALCVAEHRPVEVGLEGPAAQVASCVDVSAADRRGRQEECPGRRWALGR